MLPLAAEGSDAPAAARKRLSCPERDSFANPFPCPQGGFGDFRGEIGFLRLLSWDAFRRFVQLSKIEAPKGLGRAANSVPLGAGGHTSPHLQRAKTRFWAMHFLSVTIPTSISSFVYRHIENL